MKENERQSEVLQVDSRYLGVHPMYAKQTSRVLSLYSDPENKVVFESEPFSFEIPINIIQKSVLQKEKT